MISVCAQLAHSQDTTGSRCDPPFHIQGSRWLHGGQAAS